MISLLPFIGLSFLADRRAEWVFVALSAGLGVLSLLPSYYRHHRRARPVVFFGAGMSLIFVARCLLGNSFQVETSIVVIGALFVATAHFINLKLCRACFACNANR